MTVVVVMDAIVTTVSPMVRVLEGSKFDPLKVNVSPPKKMSVNYIQYLLEWTSNSEKSLGMV